jgi:hypothetical protein
MKARMTMIAATLAASMLAATAYAHGGPGWGGGPGQGPGYGPGRGDMRGDMRGEMRAAPEQMAQQMTQRLASLKGALMLQPSQIAAWDAYEARLVANQQARVKMHESMPARGDHDAMADFRVSMMKFNAQAAEETNQARKALVATLSTEQKATFDSFRGPGPQAAGPGQRFGGGPGMRGGRGCGVGPSA